jgi:hypothetical protein
VAAEVQPRLLVGRAVREWHMEVGNLVEEVDLLLLQHDSGGNGVDRCIAPTLIEETTVLIQGGEVINVLLGAQPFQTANLKVGPLEEKLVSLDEKTPGGYVRSGTCYSSLRHLH